MVSNMTEVSNNLLWFLQMLRNAEATLAHALAQSERFNKHDREVIDKIKTEVVMADLTLLQLLVPKEKYNPPT
ncbi:hypothetical protein DXB41_12165 [Segatella copri]|nr:hypothetical protein DXB41_12165 [Segatella copri]